MIQSADPSSGGQRTPSVVAPRPAVILNWMVKLPWIAILVLVVYSSTTISMQIANHAFQTERVEYGDESPHYLNSLVISEYLQHGWSTSPIDFAAKYYTSYPKVALLVWPPLFHVLLGLFLLLTGIGAWKAVLFTGLCCSATAFLLFLCLRRQGYPLVSSFLPGLLLVLLPISQHLSSTVMQETLMAFLTFAIAWQTARFLQHPHLRNAIYLGLLGAAGCLNKSNAIASLIAVPLAMVLLGRVKLLARKEIYVAGMVTAALSVGPVAMVAYWVRKNEVFEPASVAFFKRSGQYYGSYLFIHLGWVLGIAVVAAVFLALRRPSTGTTAPPFNRIMTICVLSAVVAILLFYTMVPHQTYESRYVYPAAPCMLYFLPALLHRLPGASVRPYTPVLGAAAILGLFLLVDFHLLRLLPAGFRDTVAHLRAMTQGAPLRVLVTSNDRGEGAFIVEVADSDSQRRDTVIRASKLTMLSSWSGNRMEILYSDPAQLASKIERLGVQYIIFDRTEKMTDQIRSLFQQITEAAPARFPLVEELQPGARRSRRIQIYRVAYASHPPAEKLEFRLPFSSHIAGDRIFRQ